MSLSDKNGVIERIDYERTSFYQLQQKGYGLG